MIEDSSDDAGCVDDRCGQGGDGGGGSGGGRCELVVEDGPSGLLTAYEVGSQSEWILVRGEDDRTSLFERSESGWQPRPLGAGCSSGLLAVSRAGDAASIACLVRNGALHDLKLFELGASVTSSTIVEGTVSDLDYTYAMPLALGYDASERPSVLWKLQIGQGGGAITVALGGLSRKSASGWADTTYETVLPDMARLVSYAGELLVVLGEPGSVSLRHASSLSTMAEVDAAARQFDVVADASAIHLAVADADTGEVRYVRRGDGAQVSSVIDTGDSASIALDPRGALAIGFGSAGGLRLARGEQASWTSTELVDSGVGSRSVVRFSDTGALRVAYQDEVLGRVVVLREVCP